MDRKKRAVIRILACNVVFNAILALLLTAVDNRAALYSNLILLQCIGVLTFCFTLPALYFIKFENLHQKPVIIMTAILALVLLPALFLPGLIGSNVPALLREGYGLSVQMAIFNVMFVTISGYVVVSRSKFATAETLAEEERAKRTLSETKAAEMSLRLLQAQIEPHFLFNTLSNILHLLDTDQAKGRLMLVDFIQYLRMSLSKTRAVTTTLGQEIELMRAYLDIFKVRMGERLYYRIDVPDHLRSKAIPSMMLQPLVENALSHGLQPKVDGGEILIRAEEARGILRLEVRDTGIGLQAGSGLGTGLSYVKERLRSQSPWGNRGRLIFEENHPAGLKAIIELGIIELGHDGDQSDHR